MITRRLRLAPLAAAGLIVLAAAVTVGPAHAAPPLPPPSVRAVAVTPVEVNVEWEPGGADTTSYVVRRNGAVLNTVNPATLSYVDTTVTAGGRYLYVVEAVGPGGTAAGPPARVKTPSPPERQDRVRPTIPEDVHAVTLAGGAVLVDWQYSNDNSDISGYLIRRDNRRLTVVDAGTLRFIDRRPGAATGQYTVEAIDVTGLGSGQSVPVRTRQGTGARTAGGGGAAAPAAAQAVAAVSPSLRRYPYLTDLVNSADNTTGYTTINWATDRSATTGAALWGAVDGGGSCTPTTSVAATRTSITVNSVLLYQWAAMLTLQPDTQYCYRVTLGAVDLLATDASPRFRTQVPTGSSAPMSFAVLGDWGSVDSASANANQAAVMQRIAASGVRFAVTTGDNAYSSGSQNNYGDLVETGPELSAVFGPQFWTVPGRSIALFPSIGNHGFLRSDVAHPHLTNWPQSRAVTVSNGRYQRDTYCCLLGTSSLSLPSTWYAFNAGRARIYILQAAWSDSNGGVNDDPYEVDAAYQWAPTSAQRQWLANDLAANPNQIKMAVFHYPLYSDQKHETSDVFLQGSNSLQGLLNQYGVKFAFTGHAHIYQRNLPDAGGMVTYLTGGGGAKLQSVAEDPCLAIDAYAIGWSNSNNVGNACGSATPRNSQAEVFHFLKVTVNGTQVTVAPTNSLGQTFDVQTYNVGGGPPPDTQAPTVPGNVAASAAAPSLVNVSWAASTDNVGVTGYDVVRDGTVVATTAGTATGYADSSVSPATTYSYQVRARDAAGNQSALSAAVNVTTPPLTGPTTVQFTASADAYTDQQAGTTNFGTATSVLADTSPARRGYLTFTASGITGPVQSAVVRLFVNDSATNAPQLASTTNAWSESGVTWNNQPAAGAVLADVGNAATNTFIEYPVTAAVSGNGTYSFVLVPQSSNGLGVNAREAAMNRPQLVVTYLPSGQGDTAAPTVPTGVSAVAASSALVNVSWSASTDNVGVSGYDLLRAGTVIASVGGTTLTYGDATVAPTTTYSYRVVAKDAAGNASAPSAAANVTTPPATGPTTVQFIAVGDTYTEQATPTTNYGTGTSIQADTSPARQGYLLFNVSGVTGTVQSAVLRLYVNDSATNAPFVATSSSSWSESTLIWNNQPAPGPALADLGNADTNTFIDYPVTSAVAGNGTHSFVLVPQSSNGLGVNSREAATNRPTLVVQFA